MVRASCYRLDGHVFQSRHHQATSIVSSVVRCIERIQEVHETCSSAILVHQKIYFFIYFITAALTAVQVYINALLRYNVSISIVILYPGTCMIEVAHEGTFFFSFP